MNRNNYKSLAILALVLEIGISTAPKRAHAVVVTGTGTALATGGFLVFANDFSIMSGGSDKPSIYGGLASILGVGTAIGGMAAGFAAEPDHVKQVEQSPEFKELVKRFGEKRAKKVLIDATAGLTPTELAARHPDIFQKDNSAEVASLLNKVLKTEPASYKDAPAADPSAATAK